MANLRYKIYAILMYLCSFSLMKKNQKIKTYEKNPEIATFVSLKF